MAPHRAFVALAYLETRTPAPAILPPIFLRQIARGYYAIYQGESGLAHRLIHYEYSHIIV
jgi:hypothetical protein